MLLPVLFYFHLILICFPRFSWGSLSLNQSVSLAYCWPCEHFYCFTVGKPLTLPTNSPPLHGLRIGSVNSCATCSPIGHTGGVRSFPCKSKVKNAPGHHRSKCSFLGFISSHHASSLLHIGYIYIFILLIKYILIFNINILFTNYFTLDICRIINMWFLFDY